jgi:malate synthase
LFGERREQLLQRRRKISERIGRNTLPDFLPETEPVRKAAWKIGSIPDDLKLRRVEITGPVERKMMINALNSEADVYMADFEDSHSPTWFNTIQGQVNLKDAVDGNIEYKSPEAKVYKLNEKTATLLVRPRGLHLVEKHLLVDKKPVPASFFDFGLFLFHNQEKLREKGTGPYFYLPKLENHLEARLWNDILDTSESILGLTSNSTKCSVLIENILAAFEMEEILFELKDHITALNFGRWDYIFSMIKKLGHNPEFVLPDRAQLDMTTHFLTSCAYLLVQTAHKRGAYAIGGMSANVPIRNDPEAHQTALIRVVADKKREAEQGYDGAWVAHPGLVPVVMKIFNEQLKNDQSQLWMTDSQSKIAARDLLFTPKGPVTETGLRNNIAVSLQYLVSWLKGNGCVAINNLMEDSATVEISRAQIWQWIYHESRLADGRKVTLELFRALLKEETGRLQASTSGPENEMTTIDSAKEILDRIVSSYEFTDFMTLPSYEKLD